MTYNEIIADHLFKICKLRNLKNADLAYLSGLSTSTIDNIMNNRTKNPTIATLNCIAFGLEMKLSTILDIDGINSMDKETRLLLQKKENKKSEE